jgi:hypothetical protein
VLLPEVHIKQCEGLLFRTYFNHPDLHTLAEQQTAAAVQLKEGLQQLGQDLSLLTVEVESQELYLSSRVLAKAPEAIHRLSSQLYSTSRRFKRT